MNQSTNKERNVLLKKALQAKPQKELHQAFDEDTFYRDLLLMNEDIAIEIVQTEAKAKADERLDQDIQSLENKKADAERRFQVSETELKELEKQTSATPKTIANNTEAKTPFKEWKFHDKLGFVALVPALFLTLGMGFSNLYANLLSSGVSVYIEQPWLAGFIAMLMPTGSLAIKFIAHGFRYQRHKQRFSMVVYCLTALVLLAWSIGFAQNFSGASGGIDWDALGESSGKSNMLVWLQLTAEILVASTLFLALESITYQYHPKIERDNPNYQSILEALKAHEKAHAQIQKEKSRISLELTHTKAEHQRVMNQVIVKYCALRARYNQANNF